MNTRKVTIAALNVTVEVPIYSKDWVNFIAVDSDGEIWMFEDEPCVGSHAWFYIDDDHGYLDALPAPGSYVPHDLVDLDGVDWRKTLTEIVK